MGLGGKDMSDSFEADPVDVILGILEIGHIVLQMAGGDAIRATGSAFFGFDRHRPALGLQRRKRSRSREISCLRPGFRFEPRRMKVERGKPGRRPKAPLFSGILFEWAPSPDLLGYDMTTPTGGFGPGIIVAPVAELFLVAVAFQAGPCKADRIDPPVRRRVGSFSFPDNVVPPGSKEFHVVGSHIRRRLDAAFFLEPLDGGRIELQVGGGTAFPLPYQNGKVATIRKTTIPAMIFPPL